jgi:FKBP-type peptidyl-prolyl cis-trans isomerase SlyD
MRIEKPCVVTLTWRLEDAQNTLIGELNEPTEFFFGGDDLLEKVEEVLDTQSPGFEISLQLEPEQAFGEYDAHLVFFEARNIFEEPIEPGMQFEGPPEGTTTPNLPPDKLYTVTEVYAEYVVLDGNHPLAGIALRMTLKVKDVREATEEELERQSVGSSALSLAQAQPSGGFLH